MKLVSRWVRKVFCFPCQVRTRKLIVALTESLDALEIRRAATRSLKEYVDEKSLARRTYD